MKDDMKLEELFDSYRPTLADSRQFSRRLEKRLALIDEIRRMQAARIRRYRLVVVAAFVAGIVSGGGLLAFVLTLPPEVPVFTFGINAGPLLFVEQNSRFISALLTSLMMACCIVSLLNIHDWTDRMYGKGI